MTEAGLPNPIQWCQTGSDALDYLFRQGSYQGEERANPGLIPLDLRLPGIEGSEVLSRIRSDSQLKMTPVVVMSSSQQSDDINAAYSMGADGYIVKPDDLKGFLQATLQLVKKASAAELVVAPMIEKPCSILELSRQLKSELQAAVT